MDRVACFIDGAYLYKLLGDHFSGARIHFGSLSDRLADGHQHFRTYYYNCPPYQSNPPTPQEAERKRKSDRFYVALQRLPRFEVRLGKLAFRGTDATGRPILIQKRVDIMLGVDLVQLAATQRIQRAVLLAGDSDFVPAVQVAKQAGVLMVLWHGPMSTVHQELWDECDERNGIEQSLIDSIRT